MGERRTAGRRRSARIGFGNKPNRAKVGRLVGGRANRTRQNKQNRRRPDGGAATFGALERA